ALEGELKKLPLGGYSLNDKKVNKAGVSATKFTVRVEEKGPARGIKDIENILLRGGLADEVRERALSAFSRLAEVEAKIHGVPVERVHFHEVGAVDSIIDIVGTFIGVKLLGIEKFFSSPVNTGMGFARSEHGTLPVPAPATLELMKGKPIYSEGPEKELLTPTGALLLTELASSFGPLPGMCLERVGYGAGGWDLPMPNVLRLMIGELTAEAGTETVASVETNIDDMNPQFYQHIMERCFELGALDVYMTPVVMKKNRPGTLLTVICPLGQKEELAGLLMRESTTLGVRMKEFTRLKAERRSARVRTPYGEVALKVAELDGRAVNRTPEYEDCRRIALARRLPLKEVFDAAKAAGRRLLEGEDKG
ncbi:MAG: nickel pincer cofactor biosynthesis protein LarC, partial [Nitrospinota bacterium]